VLGIAGDLHVEAQTWVFDPGTIEVPVEIVHGDDDGMAPIAHAHRNAELVAGATLTVLPGVGHLSVVPHIPAIAARLATRV
jgi:pimeloyl-ACP methyl ester carboxylesterase